MKPSVKTLMATVLAVLAACSPGSGVAAASMQEVRREVTASRAAFEQVASILVPSTITWANRVSVRYKLGADYRTENWNAAQVPSTIKADLLSFMASRNVEAVFVHEQRVNFVLHSAGIAPSGISIGVVVAPSEQHGCMEVSTPLKLDAPGLQCEKLDGLAYLYLQR